MFPLDLAGGEDYCNSRLRMAAERAGIGLPDWGRRGVRNLPFVAAARDVQVPCETVLRRYN